MIWIRKISINNFFSRSLGLQRLEIHQHKMAKIKLADGEALIFICNLPYYTLYYRHSLRNTDIVFIRKDLIFKTIPGIFSLILALAVKERENYRVCPAIKILQQFHHLQRQAATACYTLPPDRCVLWRSLLVTSLLYFQLEQKPPIKPACRVLQEANNAEYLCCKSLPFPCSPTFQTSLLLFMVTGH